MTKKILTKEYTKKELEDFLVMAEEEIKQWKAFIKEVKKKLL